MLLISWITTCNPSTEEHTGNDTSNTLPTLTEFYLDDHTTPKASKKGIIKEEEDNKTKQHILKLFYITSDGDTYLYAS